MPSFEIHHDDALDVLRAMADNSVDAVVTDPPYGLGKEPDAAEVLTDWVTLGFHEIKTSGGFMGKKWDSFVPQPLLWKEVFRVLKPGGHLLSFAGTRTYDWIVMGLRLAGFEIRDKIQYFFDESQQAQDFLITLTAEQRETLWRLLDSTGANSVNWAYGSGFPKSLDVGKAIDRAANVEREVVGVKDYSAPDIRGNSSNGRGISSQSSKDASRLGVPITAPATDAAKQWDGWGSALKPAHEPIVLARKPLGESTIAANVLKWGTGGLNVDGCRVDADWANDPSKRGFGYGWNGNDGDRAHAKDKAAIYGKYAIGEQWKPTQGRFPANLIHDGSAQVVAMFPSVHGAGSAQGKQERWADQTKQPGWGNIGLGANGARYGDTGSAARFFKACPPDDAASLIYCAKASRSERDAGLDGMPEVHRVNGNKWTDQDYRVARGERPLSAESGPRKNTHCTVKPQSLMKYLCRLICPPNGTILDPFFGSGSTGVAAIAEGFSIIGIEQDAEFAEIARRRCEHAKGSTEVASTVGSQVSIFDKLAATA